MCDIKRLNPMQRKIFIWLKTYAMRLQTGIVVSGSTGDVAFSFKTKHIGSGKGGVICLNGEDQDKLNTLKYGLPH